jgi:hypothetical protein
VLVLCARLERRGDGLIEEEGIEVEVVKVKAGTKETETPRLPVQTQNRKEETGQPANKVGAREEFAGACHQRTLL